MGFLRISLLLLFTVSVVAVILPSRADAQSTPAGDVSVAASLDREARSLFEAGEEAFRAGRFTDALDYFKRAYSLSRRFALLYNVGIAADRLRRDDEAMEAFERYLREAPSTAANRNEVETRLVALREVRAQRVAAANVDPPIGGTATVAPSSGAAVVGAPQAGAAGGTSRVFTWVALGVGVAALTVGTIVGVLAQTEYDGLVEDCGARGGCTPAEIDDANLGTRSTLANILLIAGGAAVAAGVVLFFVEGGDGGPEEARVTAHLGLGGLVVRGSF